MSNATGSPGGIIVSLYDLSGSMPGNRLATLSGMNPMTAGVYTYSISEYFLEPLTRYYLVLTSLSPVSAGEYSWSIGTGGSTVADGWRPGGSFVSSVDGLNWSGYRPNPFQYAVNATAIPEPATTSLVAIGVLTLGLYRRKTRRQDIESRAC